jgi:4'-phosphopantetheinyl transferase
MGAHGLHLSYEVLTKHSWAVALLQRPENLVDDEAEAMRRMLPAKEIDRLDAIPTEFGRSSFLLGRTLLRSALEPSLDLAARDIALVYSDHGKPHLRTQGSKGSLFFNLSHCRSLVALAVSVRGDVGVDVEDIEGRSESLARRVLRDEELALLDALPPAARTGAFVQFWTIKEACVKVRGERLSAMGTVVASLEAAGCDGDVHWWTVSVGRKSKAAVALRAYDPGPGGIISHLGVNDLLAPH